MILYCDGRVVPPTMSYCTAWPGKGLLSCSAAQLLSCSAALLLAIPAAAATTGMLPTLYRKHRHLPNSIQVLKCGSCGGGELRSVIKVDSDTEHTQLHKNACTPQQNR
jgi:hypothetical protein